jgi:hypothetical protein
LDEPRSPLRSWLLIALSSVAFAATVELLPRFGARLRLVLALTMIWLGGSAWIGRRALLAPPYRPVVPLLMLVSYAFVALAALANGESPFATDRLAAYCALSVGWATLLLLVGTQPAGMSATPYEPPRRSVFGIIAAAALILLVAHALATPRWPLISDEAIYFLQSEWFFRPNYSWQVPREIADFFVMRKLGYNAEAQHFYGMYPPGWPAVLALFNAVGLRWWTSIVLGAATVGLTYVVGTRVHSRTAGVFAAALLALHQWFVIEHAGYMSDGFVTFTTVAGAASLLAAETGSSKRRFALGVLAGLALGMGVAARPLSGVALAFSLVLWIFIRRRIKLRPLLVTLAGVVLGGVFPAALLLHYNAVTNGEPLRLAYQALHGNGYQLGFGVRGFQAYTESLERVQVPIVFTPADATSHLFARLADYSYAGFGIALLLPLLALALAHRVSLRPRYVAPFIILPALYFFYWGSSARFYAPLLPMLLIGCAVLLLDLVRRDAWVTLGLATSAVVGSLYFALPFRVTPGGLDSPWTRSAYLRDPGRMGSLDSLKALGERRGPLLVFARQQKNPFDNLLDRLQLLNADGLTSRVLVARDLGARNAELRARYPDRIVYVVEDRGRDSVSRIMPMEDAPPR